MTGPRSADARPFSRGWILAAFAVIVVRGAALVLASDPQRAWDGDEPTILDIVRNILGGNGISHYGYPWVVRPPGWPLTLAAWFFVFGESVRAGVALQCAFDGVTALVCAAIAWRMWHTRAAAVATFLMVALWPPFMRESRFVQSEPMFTMCTALTLLAFVRFVERPSLARAFVAGIVLGLANMVRPSGLMLMAGLIVGWGLTRVWREPRIVFRAAPILVGMLLVVSPWMVRNTRLLGQFAPLSIGGGDQFYQGSMIETEGRWDHYEWARQRDSVLTAEEARIGRSLTLLEADKVMMRAGTERWKQQPTASLRIALKRVWRLVFVAVGTSDRAWLRWSFLATLLALYALAVPRGWAGLFAARRGFPLAGILLTSLVVYTLTTSAFYTNSRYFEPMRPLVFLLAAGALGAKRHATAAA